MRLKGKNALITGGTQGLGLAIAEAFIREGASVGITGRSIEKLKKVQEKLTEIQLFAGDVSNLADLDKLYQNCKGKMGSLDIIVANAGISMKTALDSAPEDEFDKMISINFKGLFYTVQKAIPFLNKGASIILISSVAAKQAIKTFSVYSATKAAVASLAKSFAAELLEKGIRVNSISPGAVRTPIFDALGWPEEALNSWAEVIPMKRLAQPREIADVALFLASDESSYITATDITVDGGVTEIGRL